MNKVITINLTGVAYQLEEGGFEALRAYLDNAARRLEGNPDKDEIIADIEQAIADKFRAVLGAYKTVVATKEVASVIAEMGPVQDSTTEADKPDAGGRRTEGSAQKAEKAGEAADEPKAARRLYLIQDGAMLSGVCNGIAAYLNIDVTFVRIGFFLLALTWGTGVLLYLLLAFIVPVASTPAEKAAASGGAATTQEFIRRAKAGYYEGMKTLHDKEAHRAWKRKFKHQMRGWKHGFQRDMQEHAYQWQQNWAHSSAWHPRFWVGMGFTLMIMQWVRLLCLGLGIYAVYSLLTHGEVFGRSLPDGIPVWVGIIGVIIVYHFLTWPIKALRHACYYPGASPWGCGSRAGPLDGLVWLGFLVLAVWLADHYSPPFHAWLQNLPPMIHQATDSISEWWTRRQPPA